jgi:hypothetical protein
MAMPMVESRKPLKLGARVRSGANACVVQGYTMEDGSYLNVREDPKMSDMEREAVDHKLKKEVRSAASSGRWEGGRLQCRNRLLWALLRVGYKHHRRLVYSL